MARTIRCVPFNINDHVLVKLTAHGKRVLREQHEQLWGMRGMKEHPYVAPIEDAEGWSRWQLWTLMSKFGHTITMTGAMPFWSIIQFEVNE
jgi:hypothetical protein